MVAMSAAHAGAPPAQTPVQTPAPHAPQIGTTVAGETADHSKFEILQQTFADGPAVTRACLSCHTEAAKQVMKSLHWNWNYTHPETGQRLGKSVLINNFCTNAHGNEGVCAQCHVGYKWKDKSYDFTEQSNVDCLVCHDRSGGYYKTPPTQGNAACSVMFEGKAPIDFGAVARSVGMPERSNCGGCHFFGGGGDGVKHGDLDSSLIHPPRSLDVHMSADGPNFACSACHITRHHITSGSRYNVIARDTQGQGKPGQRRDVATCESCHGSAPHKDGMIKPMLLNDHVAKVACQTCHIPTFARGGVATEVFWDWRTAGKVDKDGKGYAVEGYIQGNGAQRPTYKSIKGNFEWAENVAPEYRWFDGQMRYTTIDTRFDSSKPPIAINDFNGSADDPRSRIWPFKRMRTVQPYDVKNQTLVYMHLWGEDQDAYWGNYDFQRAITAGMQADGRPYSGEFGFIETVSWWPITHMVAPKEDALACDACHAREGRLKGLTGLYLPGRGDQRWLDWLGLLVVGGTVLGIFGHALLRVILRRRRH
jgi:octaheme c-type cytochrome (tetrathionate reductase family)